MSEFTAPLHAPYTYPLSTPPCTAATTVAMSLRQFEREAKAQAETEYDEANGRLPEPPSAEDTSLPQIVVQKMKRRRKVRSAIVSRRKSSIYLAKLERELDVKDSMNAQMETRLGVFKDVLKDTSERIKALSSVVAADPASAAAAAAVAVQPPSPKRRRIEAGPLAYVPPHHPVHQQQQQQHHHHQQMHHQHQQQSVHQLPVSIPVSMPSVSAPSVYPTSEPRPGFFLDDVNDEILSMSAEDMGMAGYVAHIRDRDEQTSPVTPRRLGVDPTKGVPRMYLTDAVCKFP